MLLLKVFVCCRVCSIKSSIFVPQGGSVDRAFSRLNGLVFMRSDEATKRPRVCAFVTSSFLL